MHLLLISQVQLAFVCMLQIVSPEAISTSAFFSAHINLVNETIQLYLIAFLQHVVIPAQWMQGGQQLCREQQRRVGLCEWTYLLRHHSADYW